MIFLAHPTTKQNEFITNGNIKQDLFYITPVQFGNSHCVSDSTCLSRRQKEMKDDLIEKPFNHMKYLFNNLFQDFYKNISEQGYELSDNFKNIKFDNLYKFDYLKDALYYSAINYIEYIFNTSGYITNMPDHPNHIIWGVIKTYIQQEFKKIFTDELNVFKNLENMKEVKITDDINNVLMSGFISDLVHAKEHGESEIGKYLPFPILDKPKPTSDMKDHRCLVYVDELHDWYISKIIEPINTNDPYNITLQYLHNDSTNEISLPFLSQDIIYYGDTGGNDLQLIPENYNLPVWPRPTSGDLSKDGYCLILNDSYQRRDDSYWIPCIITEKLTEDRIKVRPYTNILNISIEQELDIADPKIAYYQDKKPKIKSAINMKTGKKYHIKIIDMSEEPIVKEITITKKTENVFESDVLTYRFESDLTYNNDGVQDFNFRLRYEDNYFSDDPDIPIEDSTKFIASFKEIKKKEPRPPPLPRLPQDDSDDSSDSSDSSDSVDGWE